MPRKDALRCTPAALQVYQVARLDSVNRWDGNSSPKIVILAHFKDHTGDQAKFRDAAQEGPGLMPPLERGFCRQTHISEMSRGKGKMMMINQLPYIGRDLVPSATMFQDSVSCLPTGLPKTCYRRLS